MKRTFAVTITALAFTALTGVAHAEPSAAETANAAYERGKASGITPQTSDEYMMCTNYWDTIDFMMAIGGFPEDIEAGLIAPLQFDNLDNTYIAWVSYIMADRGINADEAATLLEMDSPYHEVTFETLDKAIEGDRAAIASYFETLGTCHTPPS